MSEIDRRRLLGGIALGGSGLLLAGCDKLNKNEGFRGILTSVEKANRSAHRLVGSRSALAPEFSAGDISPIFRGNGTQLPVGPAYASHVASNFADWRVMVTGLVAKPLALSLADLHAMPAREQITRHDCVEGWSAIGRWRGTPLALVLKRAGLRPQARYIIFHCADQYGGHDYYESVDMIDAWHPQTILAWQLNGHALPVKNGAPLRLRVERQLGYKQAKYVMGIEAVESLSGFGLGKGGYWEDHGGYQWYAGI